MSFKPWPSIEGLHNLIKTLNYLNIKPTVTFRPKVKLDGTNAAIRFENGEIFFQSRTKDVTEKDDNFGFARAMLHTRPWFDGMSEERFDSEVIIPDMIVYGEWAGPSINKSTAVGKLHNNWFFPFAVEKDGRLLIEKRDIMELDMFWEKLIIPFEEKEITIDFGSEEDIEAKAKIINQWVEEVENRDPYISREFDISGIGEGLVFYAISSTIELPENCRMFKAKGTLHRVTAAEKPVQTKTENLSVDKFVTYFVTEARCNQGLAALGGQKDNKLTGKFIQWILTDIQKESKAELEENQIEWKEVVNKLQAAARTWWLKP